MIHPLQKEISLAADYIIRSKYTVVITGAGISTPSGIPDFRSKDSGLWTKSDPFKVASLSTFNKTPKIFFDWLLPLAKNIRNAEPNNAHIALANLEKYGLIKAIITQNIDDLHQRSGSKEVLPVHGSLDKLICLNCGEIYSIDSYWDSFIENSELPYCKHCNALLKPNIVLMQELLPNEIWDRAVNHFKNADLVLVIGSSLQVTPACNLPKIALHNQAHVIIINISETYLDPYADIIIHEDLNKIVPLIEENIFDIIN